MEHGSQNMCAKFFYPKRYTNGHRRKETGHGVTQKRSSPNNIYVSMNHYYSLNSHRLSPDELTRENIIHYSLLQLPEIYPPSAFQSVVGVCQGMHSSKQRTPTSVLKILVGKWHICWVRKKRKLRTKFEPFSSEYVPPGSCSKSRSTPRVKQETE